MSSSSYYDSDLVANESVAIKLLDKFNAGIGDYQANFIGSQFAYYTDSTEENRGKIVSIYYLAKIDSPLPLFVIMEICRPISYTEFVSVRKCNVNIG